MVLVLTVICFVATIHIWYVVLLITICCCQLERDDGIKVKVRRYRRKSVCCLSLITTSFVVECLDF